MEDEIHLLGAVRGPQVDRDEEEGAVDFTEVLDEHPQTKNLNQGSPTHSTSTTEWSSRCTYIFATAAGASGRRS